MKRSILTAALAVMAMALFVNVAGAKEDADAKTVAGTSSCATCDGLPVDGHAILLTDADGKMWVVTGEGDDYKAAHKVRKDGKKMTATIDGEPETKKTDDGKEYMVAKVSKIEVTES